MNNLSDVWPKIKVNKEIYFLMGSSIHSRLSHTPSNAIKGNTSNNNAPGIPGIYAWYYPLIITEKGYNEFIRQVLLVHNFNSEIKMDFKINWKKYKLNIERKIEELKLEEGQKKPGSKYLIMKGIYSNSEAIC